MWIARFLAKCTIPKSRRINGPLTTDEIKRQEAWWTNCTQIEARNLKNFPADKLQLNLQPNNSRTLECRGRIIGAYPINQPDDSLFTYKFVQVQVHLTTLHGGVTLTMAKVRETHWVPCLRKLTKKVIKGCWGCKRFKLRLTSHRLQAICHSQAPKERRPIRQLKSTSLVPLNMD